jgi:Flp pilus assembly protein TadG
LTVLDRRNDRASRTGVAAAELALLLSVLLLLMVAVVDFARVAYAYTTLGTCAENGALWACEPTKVQQQSPYASATAAAQADASNLSPLPTVDALQYSTTYNGTYSGTKPTGDGYVKVTVHWTFTTLVSWPGIPQTTNLSRTVTMRLLPSSN